MSIARLNYISNQITLFLIKHLETVAYVDNILLLFSEVNRSARFGKRADSNEKRTRLKEFESLVEEITLTHTQTNKLIKSKINQATSLQARRIC